MAGSLSPKPGAAKIRFCDVRAGASMNLRARAAAAIDAERGPIRAAGESRRPSSSRREFAIPFPERNRRRFPARSAVNAGASSLIRNRTV
jgi:hypothetical protein